MSRPSNDAQPDRAGTANLESPPWGWILAVWMALVICLNGVIWTTGVRDYHLAEAVENGAARAEAQTMGEESEDVIRKAIELQRDTLTFWTVIAAISDFLIAPLWLALRAFSVAVSFAAVAAMTGRQVRFPVALAECVAWQGVWVLGLAVQVVLMLVLRRSDIETSVMMFLPEGVYSASHWVSLQQYDGFAMIGWLALAWGGYRRRQSNLIVALVICLVLAIIEMSVISSASLAVNLSMRLTLMPQ